MQSFIFSINIVLPLFMVIGIGYGLSLFKLFNDDFIRIANILCFKVFIPVLLFENVYDFDLSKSFDAPLMIFSFASILILFGILFLVVPRFVRDHARRGVIIQGLFRANIAILGLPICRELAGADGTALVTTVTAFMVPLFNVLATVALGVYDKSCTVSPLMILKKVACNPLVIGCAAGLVVAGLDIQLPYLIEKPVSYIATVASPFALLVVGAGFRFRNVASNKKALILATVGKILIIPAVMLGIAVALGLRGAALCTVLCIYAAPTATATYTMSCIYNADGELARQIVVTTTLFSSITIFLFIFIGRYLALI